MIQKFNAKFYRTPIVLTNGHPRRRRPVTSIFNLCPRLLSNGAPCQQCGGVMAIPWPARISKYGCQWPWSGMITIMALPSRHLDHESTNRSIHDEGVSVEASSASSRPISAFKNQYSRINIRDSRCKMQDSRFRRSTMSCKLN